jgi:restriction system protein
MAETEAVLWGIHAGQSGEADALFLKKKLVALGWPEMGDLSKIPPDREGFKAKVAATYPHHKPGAIPTLAGQLFRFVHEMKPGDLVLYPSKIDRHVHMGRIEGAYRYDSSFKSDSPNLRPVTWLKSAPRTAFKQGALYEIGSAMTLFQVKNYAEEFLAALEGKYIKETKREEDDTIHIVAEEINENTRDFVLKKLGQELKGHPLSHFVAHLLEAMGYRTRVSPEGPDGGVDIVAHKDELGFEPPIIKVQVKSTDGSVGDPVVASLYGKVGANEHALFITLGSFTSQARSFERNKSNLRLIDGEQLVEMILQHYEQFDSRYKGLIPLRRVYVPEPIEDTDE